MCVCVCVCVKRVTLSVYDLISTETLSKGSVGNSAAKLERRESMRLNLHMRLVEMGVCHNKAFSKKGKCTSNKMHFPQRYV